MKNLVAGIGIFWLMLSVAFAQIEGGEEEVSTPAVVEDAPQDTVPEEKLEEEMGQQPALEIPRVEVSKGGFGKVAVLQGLNKVTARISEIEAPIGEEVAFGNLRIRADKCWKSNPTEEPENAALLEIHDHRLDESPQRVFRGWMFASSPSISDLQHPVYDVIVLRCETEKQTKGD